MKILAIIWNLAKALRLFLLASIFLSGGCNQALPFAPSTNSNNPPVTFELPTSEPTANPTQANTRVISVDSLTPSPVPSITPLPDDIKGLVVEVIDGDTIAVVLDGDPPNRAYQVRYLGIDAPPNNPRDPWGVVAYETNKRLITFSVVRLVRDQDDLDEEGRLLRYVYTDNQLLSILLAEQGLAQPLTMGDNTRFEREITEAAGRAEEAKLGVWSGSPPTATATRTSPGSESEAEATDEATDEATTEATDEAITEPAASAEATVEGQTESGGTPTATSEAKGTPSPSPSPSPTAESTDEATPSSGSDNEATSEPTNEATTEAGN